MKALTKKTKKIIAAVLICAAVILIIAVSTFNNSVTIECGVDKTSDGSIVLKFDTQDVKDAGIEIGDSVDIKFDTGYNVEDVPILNGPFMNSGSHIITAANEDSDYIFQIQDEDDIWGKASMEENSIGYFKLAHKEKFVDLNNAFKMQKLTDVQNPRSLRGGNLKLLDIFRGDNFISGGLTTVTNEFLKQLQISNKINLSDNSHEVTSFNIKDVQCNKLVCDLLKSLVDNNSRTYISSNNDDLTAYTCAIILAIGGASYDEIVSDYMETYKNYYGITKENNPKEFEAIKKYRIDAFLHQFTKTTLDYDMHNCNFAYDAEMYLRAQQIHTGDIEKIKSRLCS